MGDPLHGFKILINKLPPQLQENQFYDILKSSYLENIYNTSRYFIAGAYPSNPYEAPKFSKAYLKFDTDNELQDFLNGLNEKFVFSDEKIKDLKPIIKPCSEFPEMPNSYRFNDTKISNTLEYNEIYQDFLKNSVDFTLSHNDNVFDLEEVTMRLQNSSSFSEYELSFNFSVKKGVEDKKSKSKKLKGKEPINLKKNQTASYSVLSNLGLSSDEIETDGCESVYNSGENSSQNSSKQESREVSPFSLAQSSSSGSEIKIISRSLMRASREGSPAIKQKMESNKKKSKKEVKKELGKSSKKNESTKSSTSSNTTKLKNNKVTNSNSKEIAAKKQDTNVTIKPEEPANSDSRKALKTSKKKGSRPNKESGPAIASKSKENLRTYKTEAKSAKEKSQSSLGKTAEKIKEKKDTNTEKPKEKAKRKRGVRKKKEESQAAETPIKIEILKRVSC